MVGVLYSFTVDKDISNKILTTVKSISFDLPREH